MAIRWFTTGSGNERSHDSPRLHIAGRRRNRAAPPFAQLALSDRDVELDDTRVERIRPGATYVEVVNLIGEPRVASISLKDDGAYTKAEWRNRHGALTFPFIDGRVVKKERTAEP